MTEPQRPGTPQKSAIRALLRRSVTFHPLLAELAGSVTAGLFLSQAIYWSERTNRAGVCPCGCGESVQGWFYKGRDEWTEETALSRQEQETARAKLRDLGVIEEDRRGMPATLHFRVRFERLEHLIEQMAEKSPTGWRKSRQPDGEFPANRKSPRADGGKVANQMAGKSPNVRRETSQPLLIAETTQETTAQITAATTPDMATVALAISSYCMPDDDAVHKLVRACREKAPDATADEIAEAIHAKGEAALHPNIRNRMGLLLSAVPACFEGESLRVTRERRKAAEQERHPAPLGDDALASFQERSEREARALREEYARCRALLDESGPVRNGSDIAKAAAFVRRHAYLAEKDKAV